MSTLLLDRAHLEVRTDGDALALYEHGERRGCVPIKLLDRCVVHGMQTRLDSGVLMKLAEAGVTTVLLSPRIGRRVAIVLGPAHNDAAVRLAQALRVMDRAWCRDWAHSVVTAKLRRQQRTLDTWLAARPDARKPLTDARRSVAWRGRWRGWLIRRRLGRALRCCVASRGRRRGRTSAGWPPCCRHRWASLAATAARRVTRRTPACRWRTRCCTPRR
jgi:CRISPR associated protein Cas1